MNCWNRKFGSSALWITPGVGSKRLPRPLPRDEEGCGPCEGLAVCRPGECDA